MWLKQGIQVTGKFQKAQKIVKNYVDFSQKSSKNSLGFIFYQQWAAMLCYTTWPITVSVALFFSPKFV